MSANNSEKTEEKSSSQIVAERLQFYGEHVDLTPIIDAIKAGTYQSKAPKDFLNKRYKDSEFIEIWGSLKPEKMALIAILLSEIWKGFSEERKQLVESKSIHEEIHTLMSEPESTKPNPDLHASQKFVKKVQSYFSGKGQRNRETLSIHKSVKRIKQIVHETFAKNVFECVTTQATESKTTQPSDSLVTKAMKRFSDILLFGKLNRLASINTEFTTIYRGISTATEVIFGLIEIIPKVMIRDGIEVTSENILQVLNSCYGPFVARFAALPTNVAVPLINKMKAPSENSFDEKYFTIAKKLDQLKLTVDHSIFLDKELKNGLGEQVLEQDLWTETTWCPAMYAEGEEKTVIREFFEWCVEMAKAHLIPEFVAVAKDRLVK